MEVKMTEQLTREDLCKSLDRVAKRTKSKLIAMRCYIAKVEAIEKSVSQLSELLKDDSAMPDDVLQELVDILENWERWAL
jgi:hypothetical protein